MLRQRDRWWIFVLVLLALSVVPAALTEGRYHTLRMAPYPIVLLLMAIPAMQSERRALRWITAGALLLCVAQAAWFFYVFAKNGAARKDEFDVAYPRMMRAALAQPLRPIYLPTSHVHAYWYAATTGIPRGTFVNTWPDPRLPKHVVAIGSIFWFNCYGCQVLAHEGEFAVWLTPD